MSQAVIILPIPIEVSFPKGGIMPKKTPVNFDTWFDIDSPNINNQDANYIESNPADELKAACYKIGAKIDECNLKKDQKKIARLVDKLCDKVHELNCNIACQQCGCHLEDKDRLSRIYFEDELDVCYNCNWFCSIEIENHDEEDPFQKQVFQE